MIPDLSFMIRASNMSGAAFAGVQRDLRKTDGMMATLSQRATRMGRSMRNIGLGMSAAVTAPMMLMFRDSLRLFDEQARAQAGVMAGVESTGGAAGFAADELFRMASGLQDMTRFGDEDILKNVTEQLLTFTNIAGPEFEAAQMAVLDLATGMRMDLKSASLMVGKALNDPIAGLGSLSRAGVKFTDAQKEMIATMMEAGDVAGAQSVIMAEFNTQFGDKAVADVLAGAGALAQLSNTWGDLKESIGAVLAPLLVPVVAAVRDMVNWFQALGPEQQKSIVMWGAIATALGPVLAIAGMAVIGFAGLAGAMVSLGPIIAGLLGPVGLLAAGLAAFGPELLDGFKKSVDGIEMETEGLFGIIGDTGQVVQALAKGDWAGAWELIKSSVADSAEIIGNLMGSIGGAIGDTVVMVVKLFRGDWTGAIEAGNRVLGDLKQIVIDFIGTANFETVVNGIKSMVEWFGNLLQPIKDAFAAVTEFNTAAANTNFNEMPAGYEGYGGLGAPGALTALPIGGAANPYNYLQGRATGGPVTAGQPYMVGETGPELYVPDQNGTIVSNNQLNGVQGMTQNVAAWFQQMFAKIGPMTGTNLDSIQRQFGEMAEGVTDAVGNMANETSQLFDSIGQTISASLFDWLKQGDFTMNSLRTAAADTYASIANGALSSALQPVQQGIGNAISGLLGGLFGGGVSQNANGAVVMGPAYFPTRGGMASMSERDPEAIMPLERGPGGRLGIRANGGGGSPKVNLSFTVVSKDPDTKVFPSSRRQTGRAARSFAGA